MVWTVGLQRVEGLGLGSESKMGVPKVQGLAQEGFESMRNRRLSQSHEM